MAEIRVVEVGLVVSCQESENVLETRTYVWEFWDF